MPYENLFQPIDVGPITIPNRIVRSAHGTLLTGESLIAYHEARARGGVGMSTLEATSVHRNSPSSLPLYRDDIVGFYREISDRMRPYGMKLLQQIYHPGSATQPRRAPFAWSASPIPNPMVGTVPVEMTRSMIDEMVEAFAAAARRCKDGGLDGIDLHASSGYLIEQFLSPANNIREDDYGGSLDNRMRFLVEILDAIRAEVGWDYCVGIRLPNEEFIPGGLTPADTAEIAKRIEHYVDYVSLHMGSYWRFHKLLTTMDDPLGNEMAANEVITREVNKPTIVVGRIMTLDHASHIVASGAADMVSMVRALIADPELVNKARRGEPHLVRPCIGSSMGCVGQLMSTGRMSCVVNVAASAESTVPYEPPGPAPVTKKILVVGGGPAGLEAARTAALRGHEVVLYEATRRLGGQVAIAAKAPHRADIGAITEFLAAELQRLGVTIHLGTMVDPDVVADEHPDEVIIATGGTPRRNGFQLTTPVTPIAGHDLGHVYTSWDVFGFGGRAEVEGPCVVFDDTGTFEAISVADALLTTGAAVTMVSRHESIGATLPYPPATVEAAKERLLSGSFDFIGSHYLQAITGTDVRIGAPFTERHRTLPARTVVIVTYNQPNRDLVPYLEGEPYQIHLVGDVTGTNSLMAAIHGAASVARTL
jgi:2,4-dienoyl-CoA reductase-like NADH-dependent reductase (Old Yellow Enzyme family)/thioredoxin reductase